MTEDLQKITTQAFMQSAQMIFETTVLAELIIESTDKATEINSYHLSVTLSLEGSHAGIFVLSLSEDLARFCVASMVGADLSDVEQSDMIDGVAELGNMIVGGAKTILAKSYPLLFSLPVTLVGENIRIVTKGGMKGEVVRCACSGQPLLMAIWRS